MLLIFSNILFSNELSGDSDKVTVFSILEPLVKISFKLISFYSWLSSLFKVVGSGKFSKSGGSDNGFFFSTKNSIFYYT